MITSVIFDLNGTVLSDEDEYGLAFNKVLSKLRIKSTNKYPHISGVGVKKNWEYLLKKYKIKSDRSLDELSQLTQEEYLKLLGRVTTKEGFRQFIGKLKNENIKIGLATSNTLTIVKSVFDKLTLGQYFDEVTTCDEVKKNKPDPEIFLLTAKKLQSNPSECVVFEDSEAGLLGAKRAGMKCVGVARNADFIGRLSQADLVIKNYNDISFADIINHDREVG